MARFLNERRKFFAKHRSLCRTALDNLGVKKVRLHFATRKSKRFLELNALYDGTLGNTLGRLLNEHIKEKIKKRQQ